MSPSLQFRPHHFLCTLGFRGKGYSKEFVDNFRAIIGILQDDQVIEVSRNCDSICQPCPKRRDSICEQEASIGRLDRAHAEVLDLKSGETISWGDAKKRIKNFFSLEEFHHACATCSWKSLGYCEEALQRLIDCD